MDNLNWLQQFIARWKAKSPKGFAVITTIMFILGFITGIPQLLSLFPNIHLPEAANGVLVKVVFYASVVSGIISKLTVATPAATEKVLTQIDNGVDKQVVKNSVS